LGKEDLKQSKVEKKKLKDREYSTNERTRYKLTRPNKYGEEINSLSETEFRIMIKIF